jgi:hypothetical protein
MGEYADDYYRRKLRGKYGVDIGIYASDVDSKHLFIQQAA